MNQHYPFAGLARSSRPMTHNRREVLRLASGLAAGAVASSMLTFEALATSGAGSDGAAPGEMPVFLRGHFRPVTEENTATTLTVRGSIPSALSGRYFRNGHNPKEGINPGAWFYGSGMIHGLRLTNGRAEWYRNRWVRTPALDGAPLFRDDGTMDLTASAAGTSVIAHAGRILALQEVNLPFEMTPELETVGAYDFGGALKTMMTAHPKTDPRTGELLFFGNSPLSPHLTYHVASAEGDISHSEVIEGPGPSIIHDFAITPNYVIWFDSSVVLDLSLGLPFPYGWNRDYPARIGVMPRNRSKGGVTWIEVDPYYTLHFSNAWEDADGRIIVESPYFDETSWGITSDFINNTATHGDLPANGSRHARWTIDPTAKTARMDVLDDLTVEFPTINLGLTGVQNRYVYMVGFPGAGAEGFSVVKYDGETGRRALFLCPAGVMPGEPCFVPDAAGSAEDDGWLLTYVNDVRSGAAELWILNAGDLSQPPVAAIEIPWWVPAGVHGSWIDDKAIAG